MQILTTDDFARWFEALEDDWAEDVATALDVIERLGVTRAAPGSSTLLLWYQHPTLACAGGTGAPIGRAFGELQLLGWGAFREYVGRILEQLQSDRFFSRLSQVSTKEVDLVLRAVERIKYIASPRWLLQAITSDPQALAKSVAARREEVRQVYFDALTAAGFEAIDVPAHSRAVRELSRRSSSAGSSGFRVLYGVDVERDTALVLIGDKLDRSFYGDSVRAAESLWSRYLDGMLTGMINERARAR